MGSKHGAKWRRLPPGLRETTILSQIKPIPRDSGSLTLNEYQYKAIEFAAFPDSFTVVYPALLLASEAGEVCDKLHKAIRDRKTLSIADLHHEVLPELGDVLWAVSVMASNLGLELEDIAQYNLDKLTDRKDRGKIGGSGDHR